MTMIHASTGSKVRAWVTVGNHTYVLWYNLHVATIIKHIDMSYTLVRHVTHEQAKLACSAHAWTTSGITIAIGRALWCIFGNAVNVRISGREFWNIPLQEVPQNEEDDDRIVVPRVVVKRALPYWRILVTNALMISDDQQEGMRLLRAIDEMKKQAHDARYGQRADENRWYSVIGVHNWNFRHTRSDIVKYINAAYKDMEIDAEYIL